MLVLHTVIRHAIPYEMNSVTWRKEYISHLFKAILGDPGAVRGVLHATLLQLSKT